MPEPTTLERWLPTGFLKLSAGVHLLGLLGLLSFPRRWPITAGLILADQVVLLGASLWPRGRLLGPNLKRLPEFAGDRQVGLTFDDGPDPRITPQVLELLDRYQAKATFFCIGRRAEEHPELVTEIVRRGHRVENHTYTHRNGFAFLGPSAMGRDIDRAQTVLHRLTGARPAYFRAPAGMRNPWLHLVLASRGLGLVSWTRRGFDTVARNPDVITARLTRNLAPGDLVVLHDGHSSNTDEGGFVVVEALRQLLDELDSRNLTAVSIPRSNDS